MTKPRRLVFVPTVMCVILWIPWGWSLVAFLAVLFSGHPPRDTELYAVGWLFLATSAALGIIRSLEAIRVHFMGEYAPPSDGHAAQWAKQEQAVAEAIATGPGTRLAAPPTIPTTVGAARSTDPFARPASPAPAPVASTSLRAPDPTRPAGPDERAASRYESDDWKQFAEQVPAVKRKKGGA